MPTRRKKDFSYCTGEGGRNRIRPGPGQRTRDSASVYYSRAGRRLTASLWGLALVTSIVLSSGCGVFRPRVIPLLDERAFVVQAGQARNVKFAVPNDLLQIECRLRGSLVGLEGGDEDFDVLLLNDDDWQNFQDGRRIAPFYEERRTSRLYLNVLLTERIPLLERGRLNLVISNMFSVFTDKTIRGDVSMECTSFR